MPDRSSCIVRRELRIHRRSGQLSCILDRRDALPATSRELRRNSILLQKMKDYLVGVGPDNLLTQFALSPHGRRLGCNSWQRYE